MEKGICLTVAILAALLAFLMIADAAVGFPFGKANIVVDILIAVGSAILIWQSIATAREFR